MAQLSDDCFAFSGPLLSVGEIEQMIAGRVDAVPEIEIVPLGQADGRVAAADVLAPMHLPPFNNSAVDGYAVRHASLRASEETSLPVVGPLFAGDESALPEVSDVAVRIFTGARLPRGADTVFMQEDCRTEGSNVLLPRGLSAGANARAAGEDIREGEVAIRAGERLTPQLIGLSAALGVSHLAVRRRVRVAVFSTGNELAEPGQDRKEGAIYDANRPLLVALLQRLGAEVTDLGLLRDERQRLAQAIFAAAEGHDLVLTSGGVSAGDADYVREALEDVGSLVFWRVAIKPGRPVLMGVVRGNAFMGLPGNPVAVFVTFVRVVRPLLLRLAGATPEPIQAWPVRAAFAYRKKRGRREYVRVRVERREDRSLWAVKHPQDGAGILTSLTRTHGLAELGEESVSIGEGDLIDFIPYGALID